MTVQNAFRQLGLVAVALGVVGCGSLCDRVESSMKSLEEKAKPCATASEPTEVMNFPKTRCESAIKANTCNADDQKKMNASLDCVDKLPKCETSRKEQWFADMISCFQNNSPSQACSEAIAPE